MPFRAHEFLVQVSLQTPPRTRSLLPGVNSCGTAWSAMFKTRRPAEFQVPLHDQGGSHASPWPYIMMSSSPSPPSLEKDLKVLDLRFPEMVPAHETAESRKTRWQNGTISPTVQRSGGCLLQKPAPMTQVGFWLGVCMLEFS